jgi:sterol desaturase/sphingolipid hydroxylase (fatty acid hydroxylase superfamily)
MKEYIRHTRGRMFDNPLLETFSKVHPATPFVFYIPVVAATMYYALSNAITTWVMSVLFIPLGWFTWQLMEYYIHKIVFHYEGNNFLVGIIRDTHSYHHKYPDDDGRLVMPLGASIPLAALIAALLWIPHVPSATVPYWVGIVGGYMWYDFIHWSTHFRKPLTTWGKHQRSHHMAHHFADTEANYGISHRWIDRLLGTLKVRPTNE